jgi:hypothetical protein
MDADPFTPERNAIAVGALPVGIAMDPTGCQAIIPNAGTCDLTVLNANSAIDTAIPNLVTRVRVFDGGNNRLLAKPSAIAPVPDQQPRTTMNACPSDPNDPAYADPERLVYIAYPACNLVAAVDIGMGPQGLQAVVRGAISFAGGTPTVVSNLAALNCPMQCGAATSTPLSTAPRPVALNVVFTSLGGLQLFIGAENSEIVSVVPLDSTTFLPQSGGTIGSINLAGTGGILGIKATGAIPMGGANGVPSTNLFNFIYAIGADRTVRVADVQRLLECDTQVDIRELHGLHNPALFNCIGVGAQIGAPPAIPMHPPRRRTGARSPGIQLPNDVVPLDVAFANVPANQQSLAISPTNMGGTFAFINGSDGFTYVVNVNDDIYPDDEDPNDPLAVNLALAIPHQLRDALPRGAEAQACDYTPADPTEAAGVRLNKAPVYSQNASVLANDLSYMLPSLLTVNCLLAPGGGLTPIEELAYPAPPPVRANAYPDLRSVPSETWTITWEGPLSADSTLVAINGPPVRAGTLLIDDQGRLVIADDAHRVCATGIQAGDILDLVACNTINGDADCGLGETCYLHPDAPTGLTKGLCIPQGTDNNVVGPCREFLIANRRYTVADAFADHLVLTPRRRVLRTSPLDGCSSAAQCQQLYTVEKQLTVDTHPLLLGFPVADTTHTFACETDASRQSDGSAGVPRCFMTCGQDTDCESGFVCSNGHCVEGVVPDPACLSAVQNYTLRAGDAFAVIGSFTGFLHNREAGPNGHCQTTATPDLLRVGRIPLRPRDNMGAPVSCTGNAPLQTPNPCIEAVTEVENYVPLTNPLGGCNDTANQDVRQRSIPRAVLFQNPAIRVHLVDTETTGDQVCREDLLGRQLAPNVTISPYSPAFTDYSMTFNIVGGFTPLQVITDPGSVSAFPVSVSPSPDGRLWILDQGDRPGQRTGAIFTFDPNAASSSLPFNFIPIL